MSIELTVTTPEGVRLQADAEFVQVPGAAGDIGVLPGHSPLLTSIRMGRILAKVGGKSRRFAVSSGFVEIHPETILILAETAEPAEDIDIERARAAHERAGLRLEDPNPDTDVPRAELALARALNRIKTAEDAE